MRQGNHEAAFHSFGLALAKEPANAYWLLYRLTAGRLAGAPSDPIAIPVDRQWPAPLLAFGAGQATEDDVLAEADTPCRHTEALFQLAVMALAGDPATARRHLQKVVESGAPALMEYGAARNELATLGSQP
jgi:hypothetical protein